jgi:PAS domain S-box-containing protein
MNLANSSGTRTANWCEPTLLQLFSMLPIALIVRSPEDNILYWNDVATALYGWTASEAVGKSSAGLLFTRLPVPQSSFDGDLSHAGTWSGSVSRLTRDGERIDVHYRAVVIRHADSAGTCHVEATWVNVANQVRPSVPEPRSPAVATVRGKLRSLRAANAALAKENEALRASTTQAIEREQRRRMLLAQENSHLREVLTQVCAVTLSFQRADQRASQTDVGAAYRVELGPALAQGHPDETGATVNVPS